MLAKSLHLDGAFKPQILPLGLLVEWKEMIKKSNAWGFAREGC
jgi:hypothetical protein